MKENIKKVIVSICAISVSIMVAVSAYATERPQPEAGASTTVQTNNTASNATTSSSGDEAAQQTPVNNVVSGGTTVNAVTQTSNETSSNKKYQTKMGGFLWFLLSVVVNFIISCWVGNKFYKLARKSTQSSTEIRALRRDIEEKFASSIKDISEPATEVINRNESYARTDEGITMPERKQRIELSDDEREIFRKWDSKRVSSRSSRAEAKPDFDSDENEVKEKSAYEMGYESARDSRPARSYQPTRRSSGIEFDDDEYDDYDEEEYDDGYSSKQRPLKMRDMYENRKPSKNTSGIAKAKGKAKEFLSNVFPFDED